MTSVPIDGAAVPAARAGDCVSPADLARLRRVPALAGRPLTIEPLPGGLTNRNFKVTTGDGPTRGGPALGRRFVPAGHRPRGRAPRQRGRGLHRRRPGRRRPGRRGGGRWRRPGGRVGGRAYLDSRGRRRRGQPAPPRRGLPGAARRPPVRPGLRHVRRAGPLPRRRARPRVPPPGALRGVPARLRAGRRRARRPATAHRAVQQRPARRERARRRRAALAHRLRVRGQQRPLLRARQHLERGRAGAARPRRPGRGLHESALRPARRPRPAPRARRAVRLDALGLHPARDLRPGRSTSGPGVRRSTSGPSPSSKGPTCPDC